LPREVVKEDIYTPEKNFLWRTLKILLTWEKDKGRGDVLKGERFLVYFGRIHIRKNDGLEERSGKKGVTGIITKR